MKIKDSKLNVIAVLREHDSIEAANLPSIRSLSVLISTDFPEKIPNEGFEPEMSVHLCAKLLADGDTVTQTQILIEKILAKIIFEIGDERFFEIMKKINTEAQASKHVI